MELKKLGFGFMRLPLSGEENVEDVLKAENIDFDQVNRMVDLYLERGFAYFDTSYVYHNGKSEGVIKKALVDRYPRNQFLLADKLPTFSITKPEQLSPIFHEQLERCGVSYFDYYLLHCIWETNYDTYIKECDMFGFAQQMKQEGKIRHLGFSYHDDPESLDRILTEHPEVEFVQIALNYYDWNSPFVQARRCYEVIRKHGRDVIVMQPVKGGLLAKVPEEIQEKMETQYPGMSPASWAVRFTAGLDGVMMVLSGMSTIQQVMDNTEYMQDFKPLCEQDIDLLEMAAKKMKETKEIPCVQCGKCDEVCPENIRISDILATYNDIMYQRKNGFCVNVELNYYKPLERRSYGANQCIDCSKCSEVCPENFDVVSELKKAAEFQIQHSFW